MNFIDTSTNGAIGRITFNRPERGNAFVADMYRDCCKALNSFAQDDAIRVVVLNGNGKDYCTGNDLSEFVSAEKSFDLDNILNREKTPSTDMVHTVASFPKPLVAAVTGRAIGWGATMLLHCDVVIADETAVMFFPFVTMGLVPEGGATRLLAQKIGVSRASQILLTGGKLEADAAREFGFLSEVTAAGQAVEAAVNIANQISQSPSGAVQATKRLIKEEQTTLAQQIDAEFSEFAARMVDPESQAIFKQLMSR